MEPQSREGLWANREGPPSGPLRGRLRSRVFGEAAAARREGDAAVEAAEVGKGGLDKERPATVAARREAAVPDEQRETMEYEGGTGGEDGEVGAGGPDAQGGVGARRAGAKRGSYPAGAANNHTGGHSAVAEGGGCAGPYLEGLPSCCGGSRQLVRVWLQGPERWCQWHVGGMDGLQRAVHTVWGAPVGTWWLVRGGGCCGARRRGCTMTTTSRSASVEWDGGEGEEGQGGAHRGATGRG